MVEVFEHVPGDFLDLVAGKNHVDARLDGVFHLKGEDAGVAVQVLGFALELVEPVGVLQFDSGDASHDLLLLI